MAQVAAVMLAKVSLEVQRLQRVVLSLVLLRGDQGAPTVLLSGGLSNSFDLRGETPTKLIRLFAFFQRHTIKIHIHIKSVDDAN